MSICKFGKQASGNLPIMLVTLGSLSRPFAYRMAPRLKQERCFQQSNCKEITSLFPKFTPKDPNRRANSLALFFVPLLLEGYHHPFQEHWLHPHRLYLWTNNRARGHEPQKGAVYNGTSDFKTSRPANPPWHQRISPDQWVGG